MKTLTMQLCVKQEAKLQRGLKSLNQKKVPSYFNVLSIAETMARDVASSSTTKIWIATMEVLLLKDWSTLTLSPTMAMVNILWTKMGRRGGYIFIVEGANGIKKWTQRMCNTCNMTAFVGIDGRREILSQFCFDFYLYKNVCNFYQKFYFLTNKSI